MPVTTAPTAAGPARVSHFAGDGVGAGSEQRHFLVAFAADIVDFGVYVAGGVFDFAESGDGGLAVDVNVDVRVKFRH